jgi:peptide/nickel transport system substrate-binding protein
VQHHNRGQQWPQGRLSRRRTLGLAMAGSSIAALSAACKPRQGSPASGSGSSNNAAQPRPGGTLNLVEFNDFFDFDPTFQGSSAPNWDATMLGYDTLLDFDRAGNLNFADITVKPRLIERWETPDATIFTLHLRQDVHLADAAPVNGRALTSADVKWTLEYLSRTGAFAKLPPASYSFALSGLERIEAPDPTTVVVQFSDPYAPFLNYLTTCTMPVLPHEIFEQDGNFRSRMAGTGPYQLDTSATQKGSQWSFKKNPTYWRQGDRYLDRVRYLVLPDTSSQLAAFRTGQLDLLVVTADPRAPAAVRQSNPAAAVQQSVNPLPEQMLLNSRRAPLGDVRVRQAISLSIDRDEFDKVMNGDVVGWTPGMWAQDEVRKASKFDLNQAKSLLAAAGFAGGVTVPFLVADSDDKTPVQLLQSQLKRSGIDLQLEIVDKATRSARTNKNDFTTFFGGKPFGDPDSWLYSFNFSTGPSNRAGVKDPKLDALILAQRREMDATKRKDLIKQASVYIVENAYDIAVHATARWDFWQPYVKNYSAHWVQNDSNAREVWLAK